MQKKVDSLPFLLEGAHILTWLVLYPYMTPPQELVLGPRAVMEPERQSKAEFHHTCIYVLYMIDDVIAIKFVHFLSYLNELLLHTTFLTSLVRNWYTDVLRKIHHLDDKYSPIPSDSHSVPLCCIWTVTRSGMVPWLWAISKKEPLT